MSATAKPIILKKKITAIPKSKDSITTSVKPNKPVKIIKSSLDTTAESGITSATSNDKKDSIVVKKGNYNTNENIFQDDDFDYRELISKYDFSKNKTRPCLTKYELALVIGKRSKQIEDGAIPNIDVLPGKSAIEIAEDELRQHKTPFIIKRPVGYNYEYWRVRDMEINFD